MKRAQKCSVFCLELELFFPSHERFIKTSMKIEGNIFSRCELFCSFQYYFSEQNRNFWVLCCDVFQLRKIRLCESKMCRCQLFCNLEAYGHNLCNYTAACKSLRSSLWIRSSFFSKISALCPSFNLLRCSTLLENPETALTILETASSPLATSYPYEIVPYNPSSLAHLYSNFGFQNTTPEHWF